MTLAISLFNYFSLHALIVLLFVLDLVLHKSSIRGESTFDDAGFEVKALLSVRNFCMEKMLKTIYRKHICMRSHISSPYRTNNNVIDRFREFARELVRFDSQQPCRYNCFFPWQSKLSISSFMFNLIRIFGNLMKEWKVNKLIRSYP